MDIINTNYSSITFDHLVEFKADDCIFGAGRDTTTGKSRLFLIFNHNGRIYSRNGRENSWEELKPEDADAIRQSLDASASVPRYQASGSVRSL